MENKESKILSPEEWLAFNQGGYINSMIHTMRVYAEYYHAEKLKEIKPEIKLPDKIDLRLGDKDYFIGKQFGWNECIGKISRFCFLKRATPRMKK